MRETVVLSELVFYKWVVKWEPEYAWRDNNGKEDVLLWLRFGALESFLQLIPYSYLDEGGIEVRLQKDCIVMWMGDLCDYLGFEIENIFEKES